MRELYYFLYHPNSVLSRDFFWKIWGPKQVFGKTGDYEESEYINFGGVKK